MEQQEAPGEARNLLGPSGEAVGIVPGDREFEGEGSAQGAEGAVQQNVGRARREFSEYLTGLGKTISK